MTAKWRKECHAGGEIPEGAVAVLEYQEANSHEWEHLLTIGPDFSSGEVERHDVPSHIVALRVRTVWDGQEYDQPPRSSCTCARPEVLRKTRPEVIVLCGSSRFTAEMAVFAWHLEKAGAIVLGLHLLPDWYTSQDGHQAEFEGVAAKMDALHLQKIDMADRVIVYNRDGYIGKSTAREIEYAQTTKVPIEFTEEGAKC